MVVRKWREIAACLSATFGALCMGTTLGWSSPADLKLKLDPVLHASQDDINLIGSLLNVGALFGGLCGGILVNKLGRKTVMILNTVPCVLGWLLITFAPNVAMIVAGRVIIGMCTGFYSLAIPIYIGECASAQVRGMLGSTFQLCVTIGILYTYVAGNYLSWQWLSFTCACLPLVFMLMMIGMPESPAYYMMIGDNVNSEQATLWLREQGTDVKAELDEMRAALEESSANAASWGDLIKLPQNFRPFVVSMGLMVFQQLSGINAVIFYSASIFEAAGYTDMSPFIQTIIIGVVQVVATVVATLLMDIAGRRVLLILSDLFMCISLVGLGVYFHIKEVAPETAKTIGWLPLICLVMFIVMFSLGFGPIPWMMMGEIFPGGVKGLASSVATGTNWTLSFIVTMTFAPIVQAFHEAPTFWMFGAICGLGVVFVVFFVPETKGKTLEEIQRHFVRDAAVVSDSEGNTNPAFTVS